MDNIIEVKKICKKYDGFNLKNIEFVIPKGSIMGLIGENGAGKTTTIKSILNLINMDSGSVLIFGKDNKKLEKIDKEKIGVVLDDSFLSNQLNANDVNVIMKNLYCSWDEKKYFKYLNSFKLPIDKMIKDYSNGMKMKLKIATALSHNPQLLILDEPTSGLDPIARSEILDIFQEFVEDDSHSILVSSHITSDLEHIADYIVFINNGELIFSKTCDELINNYGIVKCNEKDFLTINKNDYIKFRKNKYQYDVLVDDRKKFKKQYNIKVIDKPSIEDIMLIYVRGEK